MKLRIWLISCLLLPAAVFAQELLTLDQAIEKALEYNYDIRIARTDAKQAEVNNTLGNAGFAPDITASGGVNGALQSVRNEFVDGRTQEVDNGASFGYNAALNLNWILFDGGRMFLLKKQLSVLEEAGQAQLKQQVQATISDVVQAYAQIVWQHQQTVAIDTGLVLARTRMELSKLKYETGSSAKVDYLQARVDLNSRRSDSLQQKAALNASYATLNVLMGEDPEYEYQVQDAMVLDTDLIPENKEMLEQINPSLSVARFRAESSALSEKIARTAFLPTVALNGSYNYNFNKSEFGFLTSSLSYGPTGGLTVSVPLWRGGNIRRETKVASLQATREQLLYSKQSTEVARQYRTAWYNYQTAVAAYRLEQENKDYARENLDIQKERFRVGVANTLETREAENSYVQALVRYYTAAYNLKVNETLVLELEGTLIK